MDFVDEKPEMKKGDMEQCDIFEHSSRVEAGRRAAGANVPYDTRMEAYEPPNTQAMMVIGGYEGSSSQGRLHPNPRSGDLTDAAGPPTMSRATKSKKKTPKHARNNVWEVLRKCTHCRREVDRLAALNLIAQGDHQLQYSIYQSCGDCKPIIMGDLLIQKKKKKTKVGKKQEEAGEVEEEVEQRIDEIEEEVDEVASPEEERKLADLVA